MIVFLNRRPSVKYVFRFRVLHFSSVYRANDGRRRGKLFVSPEAPENALVEKLTGSTAFGTQEETRKGEVGGRG